MKDHLPYIERSILINAAREKVWEVLINPEYARKWASAFSEGSWVESDWQPGSEVVWKSKDGDVGAKGIITTFEPPSSLIVAFYDDINSGPPAAPDEYNESYLLTDENGKTRLTFKAGPLPVQVILSHTPLWELAVERMKALAES